jgi:hypothetical protein
VIGVGAGEEQARKIHAGGPLGVERSTRLGSRDPVVDGVKCGLHGGKNSKTRSWILSWFSLKTKVEPRRRGSRVMSGDWREATLSSRNLQWFTTKPLGYSVELEIRGRRLDKEVRPPRSVQPPRRGSLTAWVAAAEKLRSRGHMT